jgi:phosphoglycolate phosphatase
MQKRRFDAIAFDWDGTLFDSTAIIVRCIQLAVHDVGGQPPSNEAAAYVIGMGLMQALAHAAPDVPQVKYQELENRYRYHYWKHQDDLSLFEGVLPMLIELRTRGYMLAVATGKSRRGLDEVLQAEYLRDIFTASRTADETAGKPNPLMLHELMAELGVDASRLLMIGDTTHDLELASNAGCASLAVSYGAHDASFFEKHRPIFTATSVSSLHQWLLKNG